MFSKKILPTAEDGIRLEKSTTIDTEFVHAESIPAATDEYEIYRFLDGIGITRSSLSQTIAGIIFDTGRTENVILYRFQCLGKTFAYLLTDRDGRMFHIQYVDRNGRMFKGYNEKLHKIANDMAEHITVKDRYNVPQNVLDTMARKIMEDNGESRSCAIETGKGTSYALFLRGVNADGSKRGVVKIAEPKGEYSVVDVKVHDGRVIAVS